MVYCLLYLCGMKQHRIKRRTFADGSSEYIVESMDGSNPWTVCEKTETVKESEVSVSIKVPAHFGTIDEALSYAKSVI